MKHSILISLCSAAIALTAFGQTPAPSPVTTASPTVSPTISPSAPPAATATVAASARPGISPVSDEDDDDIARSVRRKVRHNMGIHIGGHKDVNLGDDESGALMAIPIVGIIFTTLFGAPVMIVAAIMFFSFLKSRSLHRTVREMVAKGQAVPPELFAAPGTPIKARSDLRRGVILTSVGAGLIFFLAGVNRGFAGGEWAVGVIPLMIGAGYLLVWKLESPKKDSLPPVV